jgi:hypothetical protein
MATESTEDTEIICQYSVFSVFSVFSVDSVAICFFKCKNDIPLVSAIGV